MNAEVRLKGKHKYLFELKERIKLMISNDEDVIFEKIKQMQTFSGMTLYLSVFLSNLQVSFIVMKILGLIEWSWWLVFGPTWIPFVILFLIGLIIGLTTEYIKQRPVMNKLQRETEETLLK